MSRAFHHYGEDFTAEVEKSKGMEGHRKGEESYDDYAARGCHTTGKLLSKYKYKYKNAARGYHTTGKMLSKYKFLICCPYYH